MTAGVYAAVTVRWTCGADVLGGILEWGHLRAFLVLPLLPVTLCLSRLRINARIAHRHRQRVCGDATTAHVCSASTGAAPGRGW